MILPIYVSLERIDPALFDAAADLGATPWRQFRRVVLPLAVPGLIAGIIIVGVPALGEYVIPEILGGGKTLMAGNILADQFLQTGNYPFGSALAVSVMVVLMLLLFLLRRAQPASGGPVSIRRHPFAASLSLLILVFLWLPLIVVAVNSFNTETLMASWGGFTTHWYGLALHDQNVRTGLKTTLIIAVASSTPVARDRGLGRALVATGLAKGAGGLRRADLRPHHPARGRVRNRAVLPVL